MIALAVASLLALLFPAIAMLARLLLGLLYVGALVLLFVYSTLLFLMDVGRIVSEDSAQQARHPPPRLRGTAVGARLAAAGAMPLRAALRGLVEVQRRAAARAGDADGEGEELMNVIT